MHEISKPVVKKDHQEKTSGSAVYIADFKMDNMLYGGFLRSEKARGVIEAIEIPPLDEGYHVVGYRDVPGMNLLKVVTSEQPIFAEQEVQFIGEPILLLAGPDEKQVKNYLKQMKVTYAEKDPILRIEDSTEAAAEYSYQKGSPEEVFANAARVVEETFETGYQEQAYIEPQGVLADFHDGKITVYGSMQCPYYVKSAVMQAMDLGEDAVQIIQTTTGGGFGGKEDYPSLIACEAAVAAYKIGKPVRLIFGRREDMAVTPKRHPAKLIYRAALGKNNEILGIDADITLDAGAYAGLSSVVLQRSLIAAVNVYNIPNLKVHGKAAITNTVPSGAFRGFGAPQSIFAIESLMNHLAYQIGVTPFELRKKYLSKQGDKTSTGGEFHDPVKLEEILEKLDKSSGYSEKYDRWLGQTGRFRRGIGLSVFLHGCGFTGSAERDFIRSVVKLQKNADDTVRILVSNTDIGQGLKTTLSKIVAEVLGIPFGQVYIDNPDTDIVPNSGPTVASRSLMIVGRLLEKASYRMKADWEPGVPQLVEQHYVHPDLIPWDMGTFSGDAYPTYSWGANVVEVEVDTLLAATKVTGVWGAFDVGTAIDTTIMRGQMEGGMLQGLGYGSMEKMECVNGAIRQSSITDYIIPTAKDTVPFETILIDNPYREGPFGAKGAGELTLIGTAPAYTAAVENAIGMPVYQIPLTPERIMEVLNNG